MRVTDEMVDAAVRTLAKIVGVSETTAKERQAFREALEAAFALSHAAGQEVVACRHRLFGDDHWTNPWVYRDGPPPQNLPDNIECQKLCVAPAVARSEGEATP